MVSAHDNTLEPCLRPACCNPHAHVVPLPPPVLPTPMVGAHTGQQQHHAHVVPLAPPALHTQTVGTPMGHPSQAAHAYFLPLAPPTLPSLTVGAPIRSRQNRHQPQATVETINRKRKTMADDGDKRQWNNAAKVARDAAGASPFSLLSKTAS